MFDQTFKTGAMSKEEKLQWRYMENVPDLDNGNGKFWIFEHNDGQIEQVRWLDEGDNPDKPSDRSDVVIDVFGNPFLHDAESALSCIITSMLLSEDQHHRVAKRVMSAFMDALEENSDVDAGESERQTLDLFSMAVTSLRDQIEAEMNE